MPDGTRLPVPTTGLSLHVERHGDAANPALLLIRGLGSQVIHWPPALIDGLVAAGFHVIAFDNRDAGLSDDGPPGYGLGDMAQDAIGVLDALGIDRAHGLGLSMGGMILQVMALQRPARLASLTLVMSSSRAPDLPLADPEVRAALSSRPEAETRAAVIAHDLQAGRAYQSPGWPFDDATRADLIGRAHDRAWRPDGSARQLAAMEAGAADLADIDRIALPVLVIHGLQDRLLPPEHGRDIARRILGARLVEIDGMGHDLEGALPEIVLGHAIAFLADRRSIPG